MAAKKTTKTAEKVTPVVEKEVKVAEEVKAEPAKAAEKKPAAKKTTTKKTTAKKTTKETEKKTAAPKTPAAAKKAVVFVEFDGRQVSQEDLVQRIIAKWCEEEGKKASAIKELNIYIKPEDNAAYYVINGQGSSIEL